MAKKRELKTELFESINSRAIEREVEETTEVKRTKLMDKGIWIMLIIYMIFMGVMTWKVIQIFQLLKVSL